VSRSTVVRTNLALGVGGALSTTTGSWSRTYPSPDTVRFECTTAGTTSWTDALSYMTTRVSSANTTKTPVPEGAQIGAGLEMRWGPEGRPHALRLGVQRYDAAAVSMGSMAVVSMGALPPLGEWGRVAWLYNVPPNTGTAFVVVRFQSVAVTGVNPAGFQAGDWLEFRRCHVVVNPGSDNTYFGGDTEAKGNHLYAWLGEPYVSAATESVVLPDALDYYRAIVARTPGVTL
jgi:hypothetical protein